MAIEYPRAHVSLDKRGCRSLKCVTGAINLEVGFGLYLSSASQR